jgi:adenine phosphoribosyltransferase
MHTTAIKPGQRGMNHFHVIDYCYLTQHNTTTTQQHNAIIVHYFYITAHTVLLVDDLLATGGTLVATKKLVERLGGVVVGVSCLVELSSLGGRKIFEEMEIVVECPIKIA